MPKRAKERISHIAISNKMIFYGKEPYKKNWYWTVDAPEWTVREYGEQMHAKGDFIFENMTKIFLDRDKSEWAYNNMIECSELLLRSKRWPDELNSPRDAKSWIGAHISRLLYSWGITKTCKYRSQTNMTRDPYISFYNTAIFLECPDLVEEVVPPWYCYSPKTWRWRRRLINDTRKDYVKVLNYLMDYANIQSYESAP